MSFSEFLAGDSRRAEVLERLFALVNESGAGLQMRHNLLLETRLSDKDWEALIKAVTEAPMTTGMIQGSISKWCAERTLAGAPASVPVGMVFFRLVSFTKLCEYIFEAGLTDTEEQAEVFLLKHLGIDPAKFVPAMRNTPLGRFLMWSTFGENPQDLLGDPPVFIERVLCSLGLKMNCPPYLFLEFELPEDIVPMIPTFCDAYAGYPWTPYFRVSATGDPYGLTMPTDGCERDKGFPEVVHEVVTAACLTRPLKFV